MNSYNIPYFELNDSLANIQEGKYHYNYKTIDFMFNYVQNSKKIIVFFHSIVNLNISLPVFYKHDFDMKNFSILSLSDKLLEKHRNLLCCMYYGTYENKYDEIYKDIINSILIMMNTKDIIFCGICGGGLPALYYGISFNGIILLCNPIIYIENTYQFKMLQKYGIPWDIEKLITDDCKIHIYLNTNDYFSKLHVDRFIGFFKNTKITMVDHKNDPHFNYFPNGKTLIDIINDIF